MDLRIVLVKDLLKPKKEFKHLKKGDLRYTYQNELDEACFQHDMVNNLSRGTASYKVLRDKPF